MESSVRLPPDGVGTKALRLKEVTTTVGVVEQEVVSLADPDGTDVYPSLFAKDSTLGANFGADGAGPPTIPGSGVRGWLRAIYDRLTAGLTVAGTVAVSNPTANPETGLAKDATLATRLPAALDSDGGVKTHTQNWPASQPVTGPLTDTQLRASPVPVGGFPADQLVHAANLDLAVTALRDALRGASSKTLTDVAAALAATLTVAGTVTVANPTAGPNTDQLIHGTVTANLGTIDGAATEMTLATLLKAGQSIAVANFPATPAYQANQTGTWDYRAGVSGTVAIPAGGKVIGWTAHATTAGTVAINSGPTIPVPANSSVQGGPLGTLVAATFVLVGTDGYFIEFVT